MSKEVLLVVEGIANEKRVPKEAIFQAIEEALAMATRKRHDDACEVRVAIDRKTGEYDTFRRWEVVATEEEMIDGSIQMSLDAARQMDANAQVGGWVEQPMESIEFGRIGAQTAKQVILQKLREVERAKVVEEYSARQGKLITGVVKRIDKGMVFLDLGENVEAVVMKQDQLPSDNFRMGERVRGLLREVKFMPRGPQLFVSRTTPEMLIELFKIEVPEVGDEMIDIMGAARDPGVRAKVAVRANDKRIDPIGACIGMRGARVQAITNELGGERIDVVLWNDDPVQCVINAMAPAEIVKISMDEDMHSMDLAVPDDGLAKAIGIRGQNVRLASELTGWELNVMTQTEMEAKAYAESSTQIQLFVNALGVDDDLAQVLVAEGFTSIEEVAYVPLAEMLEIDGFDEALVNVLRERAKDYLLTKAIELEERKESLRPEADLLALDGMTEEMALTLAENGVNTQELLAELGVDELLELIAMPESKASALIMAARAPWFA
ncbi:MAG: transcription termination/antitermination protein NusA [Thiotrichales bacterium]|nr:transcription termination/antitermination protein NusA [Thiotrichales bacterium]